MKNIIIQRIQTLLTLSFLNKVSQNKKLSRKTPKAKSYISLIWQLAFSLVFNNSARFWLCFIPILDITLVFNWY